MKLDQSLVNNKIMKGYKMKNYMVTHTFKSKEAKAKMSEVVSSMKMEDIVKSVTGETAKCQMTWNTPGETLTMFC